VSDRKTSRVSRRAFIGAGVVGVGAVGATGAIYRWRTVGRLPHQQGVPGLAPVDHASIATIVSFLGAYHGIELSAVDTRDLSERLIFAAENDGAWGLEFYWMADLLDEISAGLESRPFADASLAARVRVIKVAVSADESWRSQRIRAFLHPEGSELLRMRKVTLPFLLRLYRYSGVPWRQRGYSSWPGVPDDRLAYTRPLADEPRCK